MKRVYVILSLAISVLGTAGLLRAQGGVPESVVIAGTGSPGTYTTRLSLANVTNESVSVNVYAEAWTITVGECPIACPVLFVTIPPNASKEVTTRGTPFDSGLLQALYVTLVDGPALPVVRAVAENTFPYQHVALPCIRLSTLNGAGGGTLDFPDAMKNQVAHSNIAVGAVASDGVNALFEIKVEVFGSDGSVLAVGEFHNQLNFNTEAGTNIFLGDVVGLLGLTALDHGHIRVTKLSGDGSLWGAMATSFGDGTVLMSEGQNP
jgi:hypothetical protein